MDAEVSSRDRGLNLNLSPHLLPYVYGSSEGFGESAHLPRHTGAVVGAQWLSGRVLDSRPRGCEFEPHLHPHINPCLVLVQPRNTRPDITEKLLTGK